MDPKIGGDIFIRIAISVSANHPDLLAPQSLTKRLQNAEFITDAIDARLALVIGFYDDILPEVTHDPIDGDLFV